MNKKIIVYIPFNNMDVLGKLNIALTKEWIDKRILIFMNYTLRSIKNQTNQDFIAYVVYHVKSKNFIEQALAKYPPLPPNIHFIMDENYEIKVKEIIKNYKFFYELHLYSDDMYHKTFVEQLQNYEHKSRTAVLICQNGYIYDSIHNRLAKYFNFSSSFNCFIYNVGDYLNGNRHKMAGWTTAIRFPHEKLEKPNYINHCHDTNSAFYFENERMRKHDKDVWKYNQGATALFGEEITNENEKKKILEEYIGEG
ncbi:glycosyltransferase [Priestia megaterium]|uniref:glycosyltransferase n=1 Tax=Priestia megaterium TaxID=1404 RepID=UPI0029FAD94D|nr:glycosyltransferase [Bacillus sp. ET1]MED3816029.1 glycosyltransferase [Priestia megaterium]